MNDSKIQRWFGQSFGDLDPLLQEVHLHGARLAGDVDIHIPNGIAGVLGRRLARKIGVPVTGATHRLKVDISHGEDGMHWDRCFDDSTYMRSIFHPVGTRSDGYWLEKTGALEMRLAVDIKDGGWYWRCLSIRLHGVRLPLRLFPNSQAFKTIEDGRYKFYVGFSLPFIGVFLSYRGSLSKFESQL